VSASLPLSYATECNAVKLVKKILGENEVESVLQRLDRLTLDEARTTATETLEVVHGLVQNMRIAMDGEATVSCLTLMRYSIFCLLDGKASADAIWDALSRFGWREEAISVSDHMIEVMQGILNKVNESQRELFISPTSLIRNIETVL
jgi:hypothetical protein